ncbi:MAG: Ig-like domain-containing protein [Defluviitaleaceae bacterium]|nr:Ig-like domain-containing protein [Defluviitaleaceae bacterium]
MNETIDIMPLNEYEHEHDHEHEHCKEIEAPCHPEACRKFDVFVPFTVTPFGRADEEHIDVDCDGESRIVEGNHCHGQGPTEHEFTVAQRIKVTIPMKFGAEVCVEESCDEDLGSCEHEPEPEPIEPTHVTLCRDTLKINRYNTYQLTATVYPENAKDKSVTWTSNYPTYASVSPTGMVTAIREGRARITVTTVNGKYAYCDVEVNED